MKSSIHPLHAIQIHLDPEVAGPRRRQPTAHAAHQGAPRRRMSRRLLAFLAVAGAVLPVTAAAKEAAKAGGVALFPAQTAHLDGGERETLDAVFAGALAERGALDIDPERAAAVLEESEGYAAAAQALGAATYLRPSAVGLASKISVRLGLYDDRGRMLDEAQMAAFTLDDLPPVAERLLEAVLSGVSVDETRTRLNVTSEEGEGDNKLFQDIVLGPKIGMVFPFAAGVAYAPQGTVQFDVRIVGSRYVLSMSGGALIPTPASGNQLEAGGLIAQLGIAYLFDFDTLGLTLGGGISPRLLFGPANAGLRFAPYVSVGGLFFRESTTQAYAEAQVAQNVIPDLFGNGDEAWATEATLAVGIGW